MAFPPSAPKAQPKASTYVTSSRPAKDIAHHRNQAINRQMCRVSIIKASNTTTNKQ
jgi:hypothetical protein